MSKEQVCEVRVVFEREPGMPAPTVADVERWVMHLLLTGIGPEGYNGLRYSKPRVVQVTLP